MRYQSRYCSSFLNTGSCSVVGSISRSGRGGGAGGFGFAEAGAPPTPATSATAAISTAVIQLLRLFNICTCALPDLASWRPRRRA